MAQCTHSSTTISVMSSESPANPLLQQHEPASTLPDGYRLRQLLATTHFSSVWLASAPWGARHIQGLPPSPVAEEATTESLARRGSCWASRRREDRALDAPAAGRKQAVYDGVQEDVMAVIKAVDASRPTHAAVAAIEAAALRHLAATATATVDNITADGIPTAVKARGSAWPWEHTSRSVAVQEVAGSPGGTKTVWALSTGAGCADPGAAGTPSTAPSGATNASGTAQQPTAPWPYPFVRLLDTFTTTCPALAGDGVSHTAGRHLPPGAQRSPISSSVNSSSESSEGDGVNADHDGRSAAARSSQPVSAHGRDSRHNRPGRWRCLVLERLGPTAADLLEAWRRRGQERRRELGWKGQMGQEQGEEQRPAHRQQPTATVGKQAPDQSGWVQKQGEAAAARGSPGGEQEGRQRQRRGGLPPHVVRCFAVQALTALDLVHRSAHLVHCDIKPDNFALKRLPGAATSAAPEMPDDGHARPSIPPRTQQVPAGPVPTLTDKAANQQSSPSCGQGLQSQGREAPGAEPRQERWSLLDFGSACSLQPGGQVVADGPAGRGAKGHIRPCSQVLAGGPLEPSDDPAASTVTATTAAAAAAAWYDTPSYAAPELTLGLTPSPTSDLWSLGCTVFELATGAKLLPVPQQASSIPATPRAASSRDPTRTGPPDASELHLALVVGLLGRPPAGLLRRAPRGHWFFDTATRRMHLEDEFDMPPRRPLAERLRRCSAEERAAAAAAAAGRAATREGQRNGNLLSGGCSDRRSPICAFEGGSKSAEAGKGGNGLETTVAAAEMRGLRGYGTGMEWLEYGNWDERGEWDEQEWSGLHSFLVPLLQWDPRDRPPAHVAVRHPWLDPARRTR